MELEPIDPDTAVELYLADREPELASVTLYSHGIRLGFFVEWREDRDIDNLNDPTCRKLNEYRLWRRNDGDLAPASENCQMNALRVFVRWLESFDGAPQGLHEKVRSPAVSREEGSRDVMLESDDAEAVLSYLETYHYAWVEHVTCRCCGTRCYAAARLTASTSTTTVVRNAAWRSSTDRRRNTPIKNGKRGERLIALSGWQCNLLDDWIRERRHNVEDDYGRRPLLRSAHGRVARATIRKYCCRWTGPARTGRTVRTTAIPRPVTRRTTRRRTSARRASVRIRSLGVASRTT